MSVEIAIPLATVLVMGVVLASYHLRVSKLRRQESANIHKRRDITPPLRQGATHDA